MASLNTSSQEERQFCFNTMQETIEKLHELKFSPVNEWVQAALTTLIDKLNSLSLGANRQNLQVFTNQIRTTARFIESLYTYPLIVNQETLFEKCFSLSCDQLQRMAQAIIENKEEEFKTAYYLLLLLGHRLHALKGSTLLREATEKLLENIDSQGGKALLKEALAEEFRVIYFPQNSRSKIYIRSITNALKLILDGWNKTSPEQKRDQLKGLNEMGFYLVNLLNQPTPEDNRYFEEYFKQIISTTQTATHTEII